MNAPGNNLRFPVMNFEIPEPPRMTSEQYDRFLDETLQRDEPPARMLYLPVPAKFILVKENGPVNSESGGTKR